MGLAQGVICVELAESYRGTRLPRKGNSKKRIFFSVGGDGKLVCIGHVGSILCPNFMIPRSCC